MSNPNPQSNAETDFSSVRGFVDDPMPGHATPNDGKLGERLMLGPQLRVKIPDVFLLRPEFAVRTNADWQEYEEPPISSSSADNEQSGQAKTDPLILTNEMAQKAATRRSDVNDLTAKIAALETAIAKTVDQWEPDGLGRDAYAGKSMPAIPWKDNVELDATGKPVSSGKPLRLDAGKATHQGQNTDAIRAMVKEIVRSELQNALGEQITKSIRILVRQEIQRLLAKRSQQ